MKLLYCAHCHDIVRLFPEPRTCQCGKSWGRYLEDGATTVQTWPSLSLGLANPDFSQAKRTFEAEPNAFSPMLSIRGWINPASEPDVKFVAGTELSDGKPTNDAANDATAPDADVDDSYENASGPVAEPEPTPAT